MAKSAKDDERKFLLECIEVYRALPALWKVKCDDYSNRVKKEAAYNTLLVKYRERYEDATKEDLKKKLNALRTNFRKELKKVLDSEKYGVGSDDLYEPSLWYYDAMLFLQDQETPAPLRSSLYADLEDSIDGENILVKAESSEITQDTQSSGAVASTSRINNKRKKRSIEDKGDELMTQAYQHQSEPDDDYTSSVRVWVNELKQMEPHQQLFAKKAINDILFEGRMGMLNRHSVLINAAPQSLVQHTFAQPQSTSSSEPWFIRKQSADL